MLRKSSTKMNRGSPSMLAAAGREHRADSPGRGAGISRGGMEVGPSGVQGKRVLCRSHSAARSVPEDMGKVLQGIIR